MNNIVLKRTTVLITVVLLILMSQIISASDTDKQRQQSAADALYSLGLFKGTENGFELERESTRAEAVTMIVRLLGAESKISGNHPFTDTPSWADGYIAYAYNNNITRGVSQTEFAPSDKIPTYQFMTMLLRVIGYSDTAKTADFSWDSPYSLAYKCGLCLGLENLKLNEPINRGTMVMLCANTLKATPKSGVPLFSKLINESVFTASDFAACASSLSWADTGRPAQTFSDNDTAASEMSKTQDTAVSEPASLIPTAPSVIITSTKNKTEETTEFDNTTPTAPGDNPVSLDGTTGDTTEETTSNRTGSGNTSGNNGSGSGGNSGGSIVSGGSDNNQRSADTTAKTEDGWSHVFKP